LIADQDLVVSREAVIIVACSEEAIRAKKFGMIEQLRLSLLPAGGRSERDWRGQQGGHVNRRPDNRADIRMRVHRSNLTLCRAPRQHRPILCQGKVEMSPFWQSRNVPFSLGLCGLHVNLRAPVKRRRALLASNPIKE
jgi:hypothetical protein